MNEILLVGAGPIPTADCLLTCSYNLRTVKLAHWLRQEGIAFRLAAVDIFGGAGEPRAMQRSLAGEYPLFSKHAAGRRALAELIAEMQPRAIVAISYEVAAAVCAADHALPIWADMPGWIMTEAQLKAATAGSDGFVEYFAERERAVLQRADVISVVSRNQRHATLGELALLGRLNRHNAGTELVRILPSLAFDWPALLGETGAAAAEEAGAGIPPGDPVLLWSGSYNLWSDAGRVFNLVDELLRAHPLLHFVSTGGHIPHHNDEIYNDFMTRVAGSAHGDRIHVLPWLPFDESLRWLRRASLGLCVDGVNLEVAYGSRTRVVDMLAQGLPVAATTGTELVDDLAQAGGVIALDPADPRGWAEAIGPYLRSPEKLGELGREGREYIHAHYGLAHAGRELREWLAAPRRAPDLVFRERIKGGALKPDAPAAFESPLVTWEPQESVEAFARRALDPFPPSGRSRKLQWAWRALLGNGVTRWPALAGWWIVSRALPPIAAARWQSRVDQWLGGGGGVHSIGRTVYGRVLRRSVAPGELKAVNILLARHEYDRRGPLRSLPQRIEIEAASACNLRCRMCKLPFFEKPAENMPRAIFERIAPYLKTTATLEIIGEGEPTLNPELPAFLAVARDAGCHVRLFTNGTRLTPELSAALVGTRVGKLVVSICSGDRATYASVTGADLLGRVVENVREVQDIKRFHGSSLPWLQLNCPLIADTLDSAPELVRLTGALGFEVANFGIAMMFRKEMESQSLLGLDPARVQAVFEKCLEAGRQAGIRVIVPRLGSGVGLAPTVDSAPNRFGCLVPWQSLRIRANGIVESCTYNRKIIGDLKESTLPEIWNGAEQRLFRADQARHNGINYCEMCYHCGYRAGKIKREFMFPIEQCWNGYR